MIYPKQWGTDHFCWALSYNVPRVIQKWKWLKESLNLEERTKELIDPGLVFDAAYDEYLR